MYKPKLFYSIEDSYPPYRVDITELFGESLSDYMDVEWYMRAQQSNLTLKTLYKKQQINLPLFVGGKNVFTKLINKLSFWLFGVWNLMLCLFKPVNIIQVRDQYIAAVIGLFIAKLKRVPFVYWCSFPFPESYTERAKQTSGIKSIYSYLHGLFGKITLYYFVMRLANHVFVQSAQMQRDIAAYGLSMSKMTSVPMAVPQRLMQWRELNTIEVVAGRIVYLGTLGAIRRLDMLIEAFAIVHTKHPQTRFFVVGDGDFIHERLALEKQTRDLQLDNVVKFTGFIPIEQAWQFSASAAVCVSPFYPTKVLASTSPTKLVEYMALGRPVVCNSHPEQSDIIRQSSAGLCVEWGAEAFAEAIIWMLENPEGAESMAKNGPEWVAKNRTYPIIAEQVWQQYQKILRVSV